MTRLALALGLAALALAGGGPASPAADPPAPADPLPRGAKARLGAVRFAGGGQPVLVGPDYKTALIPDPAGGFRTYDPATGRPVGKEVPAPPAPAVPNPNFNPATSYAAMGGGTVVVSADGKRAVIDRTGILAVREVATGNVLAELRPDGATIATSGGGTVSLSADGSRVARGGQGRQRKGNMITFGGEVAVWDVATNQVVGRVSVSQAGPLIPVLSPDGILVATRGLGYGGPGVGTPRPPGNVPLPAPAPAMPAATGDAGPAVTVWEVATGKELFKVPVGQVGLLAAVAFSADGKTLATAAGDGIVELTSVPDGKPLRTLLGRTGQGVRVAFAPDGKAVAAVANDGLIQRWSLPDGKPLDATDPPAELPPVPPTGLGYGTDGRVVAWGGAGPNWVAWEAPAGKMVTPLGQHTGGVRSIAFPPGGKEVVTAGLDGRVVRWDAATGGPTGAVKFRPRRYGPGVAESAPRVVLDLSPDGSRGVSIDRPAAVYDLAAGAELFALPGGGAGRTVGHVIPSADRTRAAVLSVVNAAPQPVVRATVWDLVDPKKLAEFDLPLSYGVIPAGAFSPSGTRLVTVTYFRDTAGGRTGTVFTGWEVDGGKKLGAVEDLTGVGSAAVAAAGETSAVVASGSRLWALDYEGGQRGDDIEGGPAPTRADAPVGAVAFSPDGRRFAAGVATDGPGGWGVRVYDWPRATPLHTFAGHSGPVTALAFSPDGQTLASGSTDTTVILWDLAAVPGRK